MSITAILDFAFPFTDEDRRCGMKKRAKIEKRNKLAEMIEKYKAGEVVNFEPLKISVDIDEILKKINN